MNLLCAALYLLHVLLSLPWLGPLLLTHVDMLGRSEVCALNHLGSFRFI